MKKYFNILIPLRFTFCLFISANWLINNRINDLYSINIDNINIPNSDDVVLLRNRRVDKSGEYTVSFDYNITGEYKLVAYNLASYSLETDSVEYFLIDTLYPGSGNYSHSFEINNSRNEFYCALLKQSSGHVISISNISLSSSAPVYIDSLIFSLFFVLFIFVCCLLYLIINTKNDILIKKESFICLTVLIFVFIISNYPYFSNVYPTGHDIIFHHSRIAGISDFIRRNGIGIHRVNTAFNSGYGYLNPIMYPEIFLYIPGLLSAIGMSVLGALKLFNILVNILTICISFFSFKNISNNNYSGLILTILYTLSTYRLTNVYVRNAIGETLFMAFIPLAVYGLYSIFYSENKYSWIYLFIGVSCIIQSHILGCVLTTIILVICLSLITIDKYSKKELTVKPFINIFIAATVTLFTNFWFIVPFVYYYLVQPLMLFDKEITIKRFYELIPSFSTFISPFIGDLTEKVNLPLNIGILVLIGLVFTLVISLYLIFKKEHRLFAVSALVFISLSSVLITDITPYRILLKIKSISAVMGALQFTFRFHSVLLLLICFVLAKYLKWLYGHNTSSLKVILMLAIVFSTISSYDFFNNGGAYFYKSTERYIANDGPNEYLMESVSLDSERTKLKKVETSSNIVISDYLKTGSTIEFCFNTVDNAESIVKLPLFYYYGYQRIMDDGTLIPLYSGENGTITLNIPAEAGSGTIKVWFNDNLPLFRYPLYVSMISCLIFIGYIFIIKYKTKSIK